MLAARRLQNGCPSCTPSCTAQILRLYVNSIAEMAPAAAAAAQRSTRHFSSMRRLPGRRKDSRLLSTSSTRFQDDSLDKKTELPRHAPDKPLQPLEPDVAPKQEPSDEMVEIPQENQREVDEEDDWPVTQDPESIVRQAKYLFGDSLPPGYLTQDEHKLYVRLYGEPLRPTVPEDVGFGSFGEDEEHDSREPSQNALLREDGDGNLQEVEYSAEQHATATTKVNENGDKVLVTTEGTVLMQTRPPNEAQIVYIQAHARNQREYEALLRLQVDFERARVKAAKEELERQVEARNKELKQQEECGQDEEDEELEQQEELDQDEEDEENDEEADAQLGLEQSSNRSRIHAYTLDGHFRTKPRALLLPSQQFIEPITELLRRTDTKHIRDAAEKTLGGRGFPHGPATPVYARNLPQKGIGLEAGHHRMSEINADAFIATSMPGIYASVMGTLVEVRKRLGPEWLRGLLHRREGEDVGPRVLDSGGGGAGLAAWNEVIQTEWDLMREEDLGLEATPPGKKSVVVSSNNLRHRISRFLENTQFLPRLPQYSFVENSHKQLDAPDLQQKRKVYDVIISTHTLLPLDKEYRRRDLLDNLWSLLSPDGGVLIVLEKGHPRGFEAVAEVRQRVLDEFILAPTSSPRTQFTEPEDLPRVREPGMIIAPCTNHVKCPMYQAPGVSPGRKDFCHFSQRFTRPQFLQRVLGETSRNYEDINYSFLAIRRGMPAPPDPSSSTAQSTAPSSLSEPIPAPNLQGEAATLAALHGYESTPTGAAARPHPLSLPRSVLPPLKAKGHVTLDLCTPSGTIERWVVPRSFSRQAYHDARKARWGDLWALGAKTRVRRAVRLGRGCPEGAAVPNDGGVRAARAAMMNGLEPTKKGRRVLGGPRKPRTRVVELGVSDRGVVQERVKGLQGRRPDRRTKDGRLPSKERNLLRLEEEE